MIRLVLALVAFWLITVRGNAQDPEEVRMNNQAVKLMDAKRFDDALPILNKLVAIDSTNTIYRNNRAVTFFNLKKYKEAWGDYLLLYKEFPDQAEYAFQMGNAYEHLDSLTNAINLYNQAIALEEDNYLFYFKRGTVRLKQDNFEEAISNFNHALSLNPLHDNSLHNRGIALYKTGKKVKACEDWCEASLLGNPTAGLHLSKNCKTYPPRCK